jgi:2-(1,2-epoxy-1,2-dihydrophenyl)acetyl-CoA isomerase
MGTVIVERRGAVAEIVLNRPEVLNALDRAMLEELAAACTAAAADGGVRAVLLRGAGTHFMAGGDIRWFGELVALSPAERERLFHDIVGGLHPLVTALRTMPKPVIAAVHGAAAGFGLSLVLAADLAIAAEDAVFSAGYVGLATTPDGGMTATLPRTVGIKQAAELMLLGDRFGAPRALELGIVNRLVPAAALEAEARALALRLAAGPAAALARTKALLQASVGEVLDAQLRREADSFARCAASDDFAEAVRAFLDKRKPVFAGP